MLKPQVLLLKGVSNTGRRQGHLLNQTATDVLGGDEPGEVSEGGDGLLPVKKHKVRT